MELQRDFFNYLKEWKSFKKDECLLIKGARQIGKTFIVEKFGRERYETFVEINFIERPDLISVFAGDLDADAIFTRLSLMMPDVRLLGRGRSLLFLDEIQGCPNARTSLKFLAKDRRCDVVASGSLLGIKFKRGRKRQSPKSVPVGFERQVTMHSLSFGEYLCAQGYGSAQFDILGDCFRARTPVPEPINEKFHSLLRDYAVVGGMPEVVTTFLESRHHGDVQRAQEKVLASYLDDIHKYAEAPDIPKIENCYRAIPRILAMENRKFKYAEVEKGGTARKYLSNVEWLRDARLATMASCVGTPETGLAAYVRENWYKLYLSDIGLLMALYGLPAKKALLDGSLSGHMKGGVYENLIAGILERNGFPLYYYKTEQGDVEIEFMVENEDGVVPIEVKATNGASASLDRVLRNPAIRHGLKFTAGNVGVVGKKVTLPHYLAMFLRPMSEI